MSEFNLDKFLQSHKPKSLTAALSVYTDALPGYRLLGKNKSDLIPGRTYIKYVTIAEATNSASDIKGGLLLSGGVIHKGSYKKSAENWTHIMLKYNPNPDVEPVTFMLKLDRCYVWFKVHMNLHDLIMKSAIDLVK